MIPATLNKTVSSVLGAPLSIHGQQALGLVKNCFHTMQYDALFVFTSSMVATLSFARNKKEAVKLGVWNFVATALFGTGGALTGVWAWREKRMRKERMELESKMTN